MAGLARLSLANRAVVMLLSLIIVGFGLFSMTTLKQEIYPSLTIPGANVVAVYPGASSGTVERDVSRPLEDAVKGVDGVTGVTSVSSTNVSTVSVEWDYDLDTNDMENKVRAAVESARAQLPADVDPRVSVGSTDDIPVLVIAVSSDKDTGELSAQLNDTALSTLRAIPGVRDATLSGEETHEVVITTRQADLDRLTVDPSQIPQMLQAHKSVLPGGKITQQGQDINVQVGSTLRSVEDVRAIHLQGTDGPVPLGEVADVAEVPVEASSISRVNGRPSLTLAVTKTIDANSVSVAHAVKDALPGISRDIGGNTSFATVFDQSPWIEQSIHDLGVEGGLGLVMAVLVILVFLRSARSTIITAISIPMSLLIAVIALFATDYSLNLLTLSGLTVAVGRVVDDSIVVIENIKRHVSEGETFGTPLIIGAVREVAGAITSSTITTVAVFLPLGLVSGEVGELFRPFALTVGVALLASLIVSLTLVPALAYWFMKPTPKQRAHQAKPAGGFHESSETGLQKAYLPVLRWSLRRPVVTLVVAGLLFGGTMASTALLKTDFLGNVGETQLIIDQELPICTSLAETDAATKQVETLLAAEPAVETYSTTVGGGGGLEAQFTGAAASTNRASMTVNLKPGTEGAGLVDQLTAKVEALGPVVGTVEIQTSGGAGASQNLAVEVRGRDETELATVTEQVVGMMESRPGMEQVRSDLAEQRQLLQVNVRPADAAAYGMNQGTVGPAVLQAMQGSPVGEITVDGRAMNLVLRSRTPITSKEELENLPLPVTQKQTADEQQRLSDELQVDQEAESDAQIARSNEQLDEQEQQLRDQRAELEEQLATLIDQIGELESAPATVPVAPAGPALPGDPAQAQAAAQVQAAAQATAQQEAQLEQLRESRDKMREQLDGMDEQMAKLQDSRTESAATRARSENLQQRGEDIREATGSPVRLQQVADVVELPADGSIRRVDGERTVTITAIPTGGDLGVATASLQEGLDGLDLPPGMTATIGGISTQQNDAFAQLGLAMLIAIAIVYLVMVATFRSLIQPLILLVSVPFAATGAVGLLLLTDTALGVASMIGLLMLIGIVVTNAIVLIDLVNQFRDKGSSIDDALIHGARLRLRPIIMTALATIMALVPMAIGITGGGVFISKSLAIVVIGGLVSSTVLTLILVPVLYHLVEKLRERIGQRGEQPPADDDTETVDLDTMLNGHEEVPKPA
jgi:multidrug efflux pump subunit AcrB